MIGSRGHRGGPFSGRVSGHCPHGGLTTDGDRPKIVKRRRAGSHRRSGRLTCGTRGGLTVGRSSSLLGGRHRVSVCPSSRVATRLGDWVFISTCGRISPSSRRVIFIAAGLVS